MSNPSRDLGSISESVATKLQKYIKENKDGLLSKSPNKKQISPDEFKRLLYLKVINQIIVGQFDGI